MPILAHLRRVLPAATLLSAFANAQTCYYPDQTPSTTDIPCNTTASASSCCGGSSFCLSNGLCLTGGIVSRGSCTDKTWGSQACADVCLTTSASAEAPVTPCTSGGSSNTFVCGLNNATACETPSNTFSVASDVGLILRPSQIAALVEPALAASTLPTATSPTASSQATGTACPSTTAAASTPATYTSGQMAGLGVGLGLPLGFALLLSLFLLRKERQKYAKPRLMYKLPDDSAFHQKPHPRSHDAADTRDSLTPSTAAPTSRESTRASLWTTGSMQKPAHMQNFLERYETMKNKYRVQEMEGTRHELDSSTAPPVQRHELGNHRMST